MPEMNGTEHREPSIGELVHEITRLVSTIIRGEIALAKLELRETLGRSATALALLLIAAFMVMAGIVFLLMGIMFLLTPLVGDGPAAIIVTVLLFVGALLLARAAKKMVAEPPLQVPVQGGASAAPELPASKRTTEGELP
jgi:uncharacterized membrane protein YqjE